MATTVRRPGGRFLCFGSQASIFLNGLLKRVSASLRVVAALAATFVPASRAADNPAKALQSRFEAAKASLAAGDLASAENHYIDAIALGLRQLAQLSLSLGRPIRPLLIWTPR